MTKEIIVSGTRVSGKLHIGNYLGAFRQWLDLQAKDDNQCYFFIADLHGMTTPFEPKELSANTLDVAATYLAAGIDPNKSVFFLQNHILEHATLAWIFNCLTPLGELYRMTQFKEKTGIKTIESDIQTTESGTDDPRHKNLIGNRLEKEISKRQTSVNAGLLTYPALMAADILMYKATAVPVGDDQVQHVELTRVVARKFNNRFGQVFPEPKTYLNKPLRIMSLTDPTKKMSKTADEAIGLDDSLEEMQRKLKKAVTASDPSGKTSPGVENLFLLMENFSPDKTKKYFADKQVQGLLQYSELKETLAVDIYNHFAAFREKKKELLAKPEYLAEVLGDGASRARQVAQKTLQEVKAKIGLL